MNKIFVFIYGLICYLIFGLTLSYLIAFVTGFWVPKSLSTPPQEGVLFWPALFTNLGLIGLFGLQHSIMARKSFKSWLTQLMPRAMERSTYVLFTGLVFLLLFWLWQPLPGTIWQVDHPVGRAALFALATSGWLLVVISSFALNHFELFGLQQAVRYFRGLAPAHPTYKLPFLYRLVRHPLMLGFLIGFWATPDMTAGHLLFAVGMTCYVFIGIHHEERDLVHDFGDRYREHQRNTRMLIPIPKRQQGAKSDPYEKTPAASMNRA